MLITIKEKTMFNINKLDEISAVEDLTDAAAAVVEGGGSFNGALDLDFRQATRLFVVSRGGTVIFNSVGASVTNPSPIFRNTSYSASLGNTSTGRSTSPKTFGTAGDTKVSWNNVRGGTYRINLTDSEGLDRSSVRGRYLVDFT